MNKNKKRTPKSRPSKPGVDFKEYKVHKNIELFEFLQERLPHLSRNNIKSLLTRHQVSLDGAPVSQYNLKLTKEDTIIVSNKPILKKKGVIKPNIIFEDNDFIAIDKPSGLLSVASDKEKQKTAYRMVSDYVQQFDKHNRIYVLHRIDEDTSGVLIFCKHEELRDKLQENWDKLVKERKYYAIVDGHMNKKEDTLIHYLKQNSLNLMYVSDDKVHGKKCTTHYKVMNEIKDYSLLDVKIDSGRKNQIRVQLGATGHHVIGDDKYGEPTNPIKRLGLHSYLVSFVHPYNKKEYVFRSPIPKEFQTLFPKK